MSRTQTRTRKGTVISLRSIGAISVLLTAACAKNPAPLALEPVRDTVVTVDTVVVTKAAEEDRTAERDLEQRIATLELRLLEKDAQVDELRQKLDEAIQEVVRTMAKLQSQATRAEAASGIAEAEIAYEEMRATAENGGGPSVELRQARGLLASSTEEFNKQNFGGSLYLANQARGLVRILQTRVATASRPEEEAFAVPVPLATTARSNVRSGPGMQFSVLFTIDAGSTLTGHAHTEQWVRVETDDGRTGWIFHALVSRPDPDQNVVGDGA